MGGGLASTVIGIGLAVPAFYGIYELGRLDRAIDAENGSTAPDAGRVAALEDDSEAWRTTSIVTGALAATFVVTGLTLVGVAAARRSQVRVAPSVSRNHAGLHFSARF